MDGEALTTAAGRQASSASALTLSMSWWSITAMSPGLRRLVRFLVRASTRTGPRTPGTSGSRLLRRRMERGIGDIVPRPVTGPDAADGAPGHGLVTFGACSAHRLPRLGEQLTGVLDGDSGVLDPGHHPRQLTQPVVPADRGDPAGGDVPVVGLVHHQVLVGEGRDLGQVGDDDHLRGPGERRQPGPDVQGCPAADAGV